MTFLKLNIRKNGHVLQTVTIAQEESIPTVWNGTMFGDLDRTGLSASAELLVK